MVKCPVAVLGMSMADSLVLVVYAVTWESGMNSIYKSRKRTRTLCLPFGRRVSTVDLSRWQCLHAIVVVLRVAVGVAVCR